MEQVKAGEIEFNIWIELLSLSTKKSVTKLLVGQCIN